MFTPALASLKLFFLSPLFYMKNMRVYCGIMYAEDTTTNAVTIIILLVRWKFAKS